MPDVGSFRQNGCMKYPMLDSSVETLANSESRFRFLDALATETRRLTEPGQVMQVTARMLGQHLQVNRCAYARVEADQDQFELLGDFNDGVRSIVGSYAFSQFGTEVLRLMRADQPYVNPDVDHDPVTAGTDLAAYRLTQIQAVICVPLHKGGQFVAAMAVHQKTPRRWLPDEVTLVREVVARCWESLERLRGEKALRESHQRLQFALAAGDLGDWSWDAATDVVALSARGAEIFGLRPEEYVTWAALRARLHPEDQDPARAAVERALAEHTDYAVQYRVQLPGGGMRWVSAQGKGTYLSNGQPQGMIGIVKDVTASREAQDRERDETRILELLQDTGAALAAQLDLEVLLQQATDAATRLTGARFGAFFYNGTDERGEAFLLYTLAGAPREAFEKFGHPRPTALFGPTFRGGLPIRSGDIRQDPRYGQSAPHHGMPPGHLPVRSYLSVAVTGRQGEVIGGLFFAHPEPDVFTERSERLAVGIAAQASIAIDNARLYAQSQQAAAERSSLLESERSARQEAERANTLKDQFLATLSHELRTPLSAILGWSQILRRKLPEGATELLKGVEVIERSTRVQTQLIGDLLDMSRITSGKLRLDVQPVAPIRFIEAAIETVRLAADAGQIRIETVLDPDAGPVAGDEARLQQIVWNLLANAVKFTPRGGKVQVRLERVDSHAEITVADTGIGIRPDFLPHLFDRFRQADGSTTRKYGGLGLGLSIVKHLVELHGGRVFARSPGEGQGSTFSVQIPVMAVFGRDNVRVGPDTLASGARYAETTDLKGLRVLVVDDEPDARDLLTRLLGDCGADVLCADGAQLAVQIVRQSRPDLLISDIGMPDTDGYELLRTVRALGPDQGGNLPAIALTAFARTEDRVKALRAGFLVHVAKPVEPNEIIATVASVLGRTGN